MKMLKQHTVKDIFWAVLMTVAAFGISYSLIGPALWPALQVSQREAFFLLIGLLAFTGLVLLMLLAIHIFVLRTAKNLEEVSERYLREVLQYHWQPFALCQFGITLSVVGLTIHGNLLYFVLLLAITLTIYNFAWRRITVSHEILRVHLHAIEVNFRVRFYRENAS